MLQTIKQRVLNAIPPTVLFLALFFSILYICGLQDALIATFLTLEFMRLKTDEFVESTMIKSTVLYIIIAVFAYLAGLNVYLCAVFNFVTPFMIIYLFLDEFDPTNQIPYTLALAFFQLIPTDFDATFHSYIKVEVVKGTIENKRFKTNPDYKKRDIMIEGSGFLQWLSVYTFALDPDIDILLLDEPDAHLHCSLQTTLMRRLIELANHNKKQIIVATHSVEIVKDVPLNYIMDVNKGNCKYIQDNAQRCKLLSGLGSEYSPILNHVQRTHKLLIIPISS